MALRPRPRRLVLSWPRGRPGDRRQQHRPGPTLCAQHTHRKEKLLLRQARFAEQDRQGPEGAADRAASRENTRLASEAFGRLRDRRIDALEQGLLNRQQENDPGASSSLGAS